MTGEDSTCGPRDAGRTLTFFSSRPLLLLGTVAVLFQAVDMLLVVAVDTLFLRRIGPSYLPHAYVVVNAGAVALILAILTLRNVSPFRLSLAMTALLTLSAVGSIPFLKGSSFSLFFLIFLLVRLHDKLGFSYFLTFVQGIFPVREAKQKLSTILGVSSAACILAGLSVRPLVVLVSIQALFLVAAVLSMALVGLMTLCARIWPPAPAPAAPAGPERRGRLTQTLDLLRWPGLARDVACVFFLAMFLRYLIEFQFSRTITVLYPDDAALAGFVGMFKAGVSLTFTLGQLFLTSRLLVGLHPGGTMTLVPVTQLLLSMATAAVPGATPVLLIHACWNVGFHVCIRPAFGILTAPLDATTRDRVGLLASLADSAGSAASGLVLLAVCDAVGVRAFFCGIALLYAASLAVSRRLDDDYVRALELSVTGSDSGTKIGSMVALEYLSTDRIRDQLARLLADPEPSVRAEAVERLAALPAVEAEPLVAKVLQGERDAKVLASLVRFLPDILGARMLPMLRGLLGTASDSRVLANVIEALGKVGSGSDGAAISDLVDHPSSRVRVAAVLTVVRLAYSRELLDRALTRLAAMLSSDDPAQRSAAVVALGELRRPVFSRALVASLSDPGEPVRRNAVRALEKLRPAGALPRLKEVAATDPSPDVRQAAAWACRLIEDEKVDQLARLMRRLTPAERSSVGTFLRQAKEAPRLAVLERLLRLDLASLPADLLDRVRLTDDLPTLEAAARCADPAHPGLSPLADAMDSGAADERQALQLLCALGRALPPQHSIALVEERVGLVHALHLEAAGGVTGSAAPPDDGLCRLARQLLEKLLVWVAALEADSDRETLARALAGALGADRHVASMSIDLLESRLPPPLFELVGPLLENSGNSEALTAIAHRWLDSHPHLVPSIVEGLGRRLPGRVFPHVQPSVAPPSGGS